MLSMPMGVETIADPGKQLVPFVVLLTAFTTAVSQQGPSLRKHELQVWPDC